MSMKFHTIKASKEIYCRKPNKCSMCDNCQSNTILYCYENFKYSFIDCFLCD